MTLRQRIGRNATAKVLGEVASRACGLLTYFLLARWQGAETFGRYSFAFSYALLFAVVADLGVNVIVTREIARRPGQLANDVPRLLGLKLAAAVIYLGVLAASLALTREGREAPGLILAMGVLVTGLTTFDSLNALLSGVERMDLEAVAKLLQKLGPLVGMTIGYMSTHTFAGIVTGLVSGTLVSLLLTHALLVSLGVPPTIRWDPAWNRTLLVHSLPLTLSWVFWNVYDNEDVVVLTFLGVPAVSVGHFAAAMKLVDALRAVPVLVTGTMFPLLAHGAINDRALFLRLASGVLRATLGLVVPVVVGVWVLAPRLITWIYGPGYEPAAGVLRIAGIAMIGIFLNHVCIHLLVALDLQRRTMAGAVAAAVANLVSLLVLVPRIGLNGAAVSLVIAEAVFLLTNALQLRGQFAGGPRRAESA